MFLYCCNMLLTFHFVWVPMNTISFFERNVNVLVQSEWNKSLRAMKIGEVEAGSYPAGNLVYFHDPDLWNCPKAQRKIAER
ncbi:hypothetical protein GCM10019815_14380 [Pediococcus damnosus]